jgi:23S rRNA pseudouridine2605 synthase
MTTGEKPPPKTLERVISKAGLGSRRQARSWIHAGRVTVNGEHTENPDRWIDPAIEEVLFDGKPLPADAKRYILLHKPAGYLTTSSDPEGRPTVYDLLTDVGTFVSYVGRLDLDTAGLLILTNDHQLAERVSNPAYHVPKTYLVETSARLTDEQIDRLRSGIDLADGPTRPAVVDRLGDGEDSTRVAITITEGRNRQVRRMMDALGLGVVSLVRNRIGSIETDALAAGTWRELTPAEVAELLRTERPASPQASTEDGATRLEPEPED